MARTKKVNTHDAIGLTREQLVQAAVKYGRNLTAAKKASSKTLENFILRKIVGKGVKLPKLTIEDRESIRQNAKEWGLNDALKRLTYRSTKIAGAKDEFSFLNATLSENFEWFLGRKPSAEMIDELISRLPRLHETQVDSDMINISPFYQRLFTDYADEINQQEEQELQPNTTSNSSTSNKRKKPKSKSKKRK